MFLSLINPSNNGTIWANPKNLPFFPKCKCLCTGMEVKKEDILIVEFIFLPHPQQQQSFPRDQRINIEYQRTNAQQLWRGNGWKFFLTKTKIVNLHKERLYLRLVTMLPTVPTQTVQYSAVYWPDPRAADLCTIQSQTISRVTIH